ncbi:MAG: hypothetical protein GY869_06670 [Planctomycetes bacterium]|nr:hypothetical protein [Planctomycetota bacterium]
MKKCPSCSEELSWETEFCPGCGTETDYFMNPAGFWIRFGASILDGLIMGLPLGILGYVLGRINPEIIQNITYVLIVSIPGMLYKPCMESFLGATLGKMICKIRVVNDEGEKLSLFMAYIRFFPFLLANVVGIFQAAWLYAQPNFNDPAFQQSLLRNPTYLMIIMFVILINLLVIGECLVVAFTERKRAVHDMMANSYCVYNPSAEKVQAMADMAGQEGGESQQEYSDYFKQEKDIEGE